MRTAHSGARSEQARPERTRTASSIAAAAGLIVIAAGALAGCGQVSASGSATGSGSGQAHSGQPAGGHGQSGGHRPSGQGASHRPVTSAGDRMIGWLCAQPRDVTAVRVERFASRVQLGQTKPLPRPVPGITIRDPARVRQLAMAICRLPRMPHGIINCPADRGGGYVLRFAAPRERIHAITLQASGCEAVSGTASRGVRWAARTPLFWEQLARLTGISSPARSRM
jgi:hypothetical protein